MTPAQIIAFEAAHPRPSSAKNERIRRELGISEVRYYQLLHRSASTHEAIVADPLTARRIRERIAKAVA